jgi:hypothetical protein
MKEEGGREGNIVEQGVKGGRLSDRWTALHQLQDISFVLL